MTRKKPVAMEIVNDVAVPVEPAEAQQAASDAPQPPDAEEVIAATPEVTVTIRVAPLKVERIEQARALLELAKDEPAEPVSDGIQAFKSTDGRTLLVVVRDGNLYSQEK
jgi:hypothetical protein